MKKAYTLKDINEAIIKGREDVFNKLDDRIDFLWGLETLEKNIEEKNNMASNICNVARHLRYTFNKVRQKVIKDGDL